MERLTLTRGNPDAFLSTLTEFCEDSLSTCFSRDADELCVPVGFSSLSMLLLLSSCFLLLHERCRYRRQSPEDILIFLYSLLGNLCGAVGATLARQLHIQVLMSAVGAALDAVHFMSWCFPALLCWNSKTERRMRMIRRRRRQHLLAAFVLLVVTSSFLQSRVTHLQSDRPLRGRRLMHITISDNTEILGYILGLLSFVIACTSRFPGFLRAFRGQILTQAHMFSGLLCSLAGTLHAVAILLYDTQFGFFLRVMPWLMSAICCVVLDLLGKGTTHRNLNIIKRTYKGTSQYCPQCLIEKILIIHKFKQGSRQQLTSFSSDMECLLGFLQDDAQRKQQVKTSAPTKGKNVHKMTEMGRYMDVSVPPAGKACLKKVMSEEEVHGQLLNGMVQVIRMDSFYSSDTSCDSSLSSDLEWDFEEDNAQWRAPTANQQLSQGGWPTIPKLCSYAMSGFLQKPLSGTHKCESVSSASLTK